MSIHAIRLPKPFTKLLSPFFCGNPPNRQKTLINSWLFPPVNVRIEVLDIVAVVVLVCLVFVGYLFLTPTSITQSTSATSLVQTSGTPATYYINFSARDGYRAIPLSIADINFTGPGGWTYSIEHTAFTLYSGSSFSDVIDVYVPANATPGSNSTLSFSLLSPSAPGGYAQSFSFRTIAASKPFVQSTGEVITVDTQGLDFVPWYAVIGPFALVAASVGTGIVLVYPERPK